MKIKVNNIEITTDNIQRIVIYGDGVILYDNPERYFEQYTIEGEKLKSITLGKLNTLYLNNEPKRANKENLNRKDNYIIKWKNEYSLFWGYALYIHKDEINVEYLGEKIAMQTKTETNYLHTYNFKFAAGAIRDVWHFEKLPYDKDFILPDGARFGSYMGTEKTPCFEIKEDRTTGEKFIAKRWITQETIHETITTKRFYSKTIYSDDEKQRREYVKLINKKRCFYKDISSYEIEKLQQYFDIKLKEV